MKKTGFYKNCERCIKPFWCYQYNAGKRRFCSTVCSNKTTAPDQSKTKRDKAPYNLTDARRNFANYRYKEWRMRCIARDNMMCRRCNKGVAGKNQAVVHHVKSWKDYPALRYEVTNGLTLCRKCHNIVDEQLGRGRYGYS